MNPMTLSPGQAVTLQNGVRGVLFARTGTLRRRGEGEPPATWYFLPDAPACVGVVVVLQPREIAETHIAQTHGIRAGAWPRANFRLWPAARSAVYAAHMQGRALPFLEA